ncbi:hypothetical protein EIN_386890 [Entamoeba invadens IP1]|uniref:Uncharacterized protein n=1 Tax=Entamoeba invadens IP1 TaxID=370355 RepID=A0A0A1UAH7_ENTIV|nr:hypothetical protein EIN_386890 [Entamoeba invadens IP1]ELP91995.1 hypothetical protein EIN_386890 [Entamoeba invadens IP1]|eukprot:XP_004258766.1 hypothetical protein EIN_386890 [Entamoeba invadens IP1]
MIEKMKGHKRDSDFVISKLDFSNLEIDNLSVEGGMNTLKGFELLGNGEKLLSVLRPVSVSSQISSPVTRQCQVEERRQNTVMESSSRVCESRFGAMTTAAATTTTTATACNGSIFRDSDFIFNDDSKRDDNNNKRNLKDILGLEQLEEEREEEVKIEEICIEEHPQPQMQIVPQVPEVQQFQQIPQMQIIPEMQIQDCGCWGDCCYYYYPCQEIVYEQAELSQNGEGLNENKSALVEGFLHHSSSSQSFENGFLQSTVFDYWK